MSEEMEVEDEVEIEDISTGKMCPFLMQAKHVGDFADTPLECVGEACALFQQMSEDYVVRDENGDAVMEDILDESGNPIVEKGVTLRQMKVQRKNTVGCALALQTRLQYMNVLNSADMSRSGNYIGSMLKKLAVPVNMNRQQSGIVVPTPGFRSQGV